MHAAVEGDVADLTVLMMAGRDVHLSMIYVTISSSKHQTRPSIAGRDPSSILNASNSPPPEARGPLTPLLHLTFFEKLCQSEEHELLDREHRAESNDIA